MNGLEFGYEFIEKFVQVPFSIPCPSEHQIEQYIRSLGRQDGGSRWEVEPRSLRDQAQVAAEGRREGGHEKHAESGKGLRITP